ncbi:MAG: hypothetical protein DKT66_11470 [Candidatus Melainabacteria bacterium]|nr:MAG: hypothetical protein DKT66_11470 [Candidatus Melainabacteria bacterium]
MFKSVRWKIALLFIGLSSLIYILLSVVGAIFFYNGLSHAIDEDLRIFASQIGHAINLEGNKPAFRDWLRVVETEPARSVTSMQLFDTQGVLLEQYGARGIPKLLSGGPEVSENGLTMRVRQTKLMHKGNLVGYLQLQLSVARREEATHEFLATMGIMAPFVLLAFGICSYFVAGRAVEPIEQLVSTLRNFVGDAGHELNTPAGIVQARAQSLGRKLERDGIISDDLAIIISSAERMGKIVRDLLLLAELDAKTELKTNAFDLAHLLTAIVEEYKIRFDEKEINVSLQCNGSSLIETDKDAIEMVIRNLLENSLKYTHSNGVVRVSCQTSGNSIKIEVLDTGIGIPSESIGKIFDRFYRVDKSRTRSTGGSGLGLSIVKALVDGLGGEITVKSQLGQGSTFTVSLPLSRKAGVAQKLHTISF